MKIFSHIFPSSLHVTSHLQLPRKIPGANPSQNPACHLPHTCRLTDPLRDPRSHLRSLPLSHPRASGRPLAPSRHSHHLLLPRPVSPVAWTRQPVPTQPTASPGPSASRRTSPGPLMVCPRAVLIQIQHILQMKCTLFRGFQKNQRVICKQ